MEDFRLIAARKLIHDSEAWRNPGYLGLVTRTLQQMQDGETISAVTHAEIEMLMKKLRLAVKPPAISRSGR